MSVVELDWPLEIPAENAEVVYSADMAAKDLEEIKTSLGVIQNELKWHWKSIAAVAAALAYVFFHIFC